MHEVRDQAWDRSLVHETEDVYADTVLFLEIQFFEPRGTASGGYKE